MIGGLTVLNMCYFHFHQHTENTSKESGNITTNTSAPLDSTEANQNNEEAIIEKKYGSTANTTKILAQNGDASCSEESRN